MSGPLIWPLPPDQTTQEVDATNLRPGDIIVDAAGNTARCRGCRLAGSWPSIAQPLPFFPVSTAAAGQFCCS